MQTQSFYLVNHQPATFFFFTSSSFATSKGVQWTLWNMHVCRLELSSGNTVISTDPHERVILVSPSKTLASALHRMCKGQRAASVLHSQRDSHATASKRACKVSIGRPFSEQGQALVDSRMNERSWVAAFPDPFECQAFILDCLGVKITTVECKGARQREEAAIPTRLPQTATSRSMTTPEPSSLLAASSDSYIAHPKVPRSRRPAIVQTTPLVDEPFWLPAKVELSERPAHYHEVIFPRFDQKPKVESAGNLLEDDDSDETEVYSNPELNGTFLSALASLEQKVPAKQAQPPQPVRKSGYLDDLWSLMENWQTTHVSIVEDESDEEAELDLL